MRKSIFTLLFVISTLHTFSQNNPRPSKSRFWNSKLSTFTIKPGDVLVYEIEDNGKKYNFFATIEKYGNAISFSYSMPERDVKGSTTISSTAVKSATSYNQSFTNGNINLKEKSTIWLSKNNYRDIAGADKQTQMDLGKGLETFVRQTTSTQKIIYKGNEKIMTVYKIAAQNGAGVEEVSVLTDMDNPLMVKLDSGFKAILKEVR